MSVDESQSVTITIKAIVQLSSMVLFTMLYTVVLTTEFVVKTVMYFDWNESYWAGWLAREFRTNCYSQTSDRDGTPVESYQSKNLPKFNLIM